ncbi:MAG: Zn-binding domain-containing protein, partial [Gallionellaceae bacterium]
TTRAKMCPSCGYLHPITAGDGLDQCERCGNPLQDELRSLFRLQNVATKRRDKINSDEEERTRMGYEIRTGVRFTEHQGQTMVRTATIQKDGEVLARLSYGNAATLWRINLGWRRRKNKGQHGFVLDTERGYWAKNETIEDDPEDPMSALTRRVIPFVEDRRNSLLFEPAEELAEEQIASLTAALKNAIQIKYQLEGSELAAEPLPSRDERRLILLYEASEGGAGVLRRLVHDSKAFAEVARQALSICHFDPDTGEDLHRAERAQEDCEAACYDCLMSYYNQMDHQILDRQSIRDLLLSYAHADVETSPVASSRSEHLQGLRNLCQSDLELKWLEQLETKKYRLPSKAQQLLRDCNTRPDFLYEKEQVAIYVDGYHHLDKERQRRDSLNTECLDNLGYIVLRFGILDNWEKLFAENTYLFGKTS